MAFASLDSAEENAPLVEINMVPLIIIFMVTAPLLTHAVKVDLPRAVSAPNLTRPDKVQLAIDGTSQMLWNGDAVDAAQLAQRLNVAAARQPQPELHIRAERTTPYEKVAQVMSESARQGLTRIGFVTDPSAPR